MKNYDYIVIGGGIVGVATAYNLLEKRPGSRVVLIEKSSYLAAEQTGHNSGVIHAGVYYAPGSMKAKFCKIGADWTKNFCEENNIPFEQTGKMIVATNYEESRRLYDLFKRTQDNDIQTEMISPSELKKREPNITGTEAIFVHDTGIVDYRQVTRALAEKFKEMGGQIRVQTEAYSIEETDSFVEVRVKDLRSKTRIKYEMKADKIIVCGGIQADRIAKFSGMDVDWRMVPFKGEYYRLPEKYNNVVNSLIYPVPDPSVPFLGVHLTRMINGSVTVGPNAVLGLSRSGYNKTSFNPKDVYDFATDKAFWKLAKNNIKTGVSEVFNSLYKPGYLKEVQKYCPEITVEDLLPYPPGIRAQAVDNNGNMIEDFDMRSTARMLHVVNAPSPAATSAMPIADHITARSLGEEPKY